MIFFWGLFFTACTASSGDEERVKAVENFPLDISADAKRFDWQGHRGARGLLPENSIPAFLKAVDLGVSTLELDVVVSKDQQLIISHEPFFSHIICLDQQGQAIDSAQELSLNIYEYTAAEIQAFDCGSVGHPGFPEQQKMKVYKPTLEQAIQAVEKYIQENNRAPVNYNIETKSSPEGDDVYHPQPAKFAELLHNSLKSLGILERVFIQSFDIRTLQAFKKLDEGVPLVLLVGNEESLADNIQRLGFTPSVYSPFYQRLTWNEIQEAHQLGMKVIPWTVNEIKDMRRLREMGVDGIISDYPDRFEILIEEAKN